MQDNQPSEIFVTVSVLLGALLGVIAGYSLGGLGGSLLLGLIGAVAFAFVGLFLRGCISLLIEEWEVVLVLAILIGILCVVALLWG